VPDLVIHTRCAVKELCQFRHGVVGRHDGTAGHPHNALTTEEVCSQSDEATKKLPNR
jgi:hypothetical protein